MYSRTSWRSTWIALRLHVTYLATNLPAAAEERGVGQDSPHLAALVDFMEVAGWIEPDPGADPIGRGEVGMPVRRITGRGAEVLREDAG